MYNHPRLNQEETENINRLISSNEIEPVIKNKNKKTPNKSHGLNDFTGEFYQTFRRVNTYPSEVIPKKSKRKKHFRTHSMRPSSP